MRSQETVVRSQESGVGRSVGSVRSVGFSLFLLAVSAQAATFEEQRKEIAASPATQTESAILTLLKTGLDEGKPVLALADASKWLLQNQPKDAVLLYYAGRSAELSGDWKAAVALYQQYLKSADLKSATADEAVYAVYVLLLERLKDDNGAYAFGRNDGGRLLVCPRARQFDQWFLDQAVSRNDATAVAQRLNAGIMGGLPADLLVARYSQYFRWLLGTIDGYCDQPGSTLTQDHYDAIKDLCGVITHDEEIRLRLDWAVSVKAYNLAKIGDKSKAKVAKRPGKVKGFSALGGVDAGKKPPKKDIGKKAADAKAAAAQRVEEAKLELGDEATPPIAEAAALLEKYPRYAMWVMAGWAGGGNGQYYRGDTRQYWPHEVEAKMAPMLEALSKLTPTEAAEFLNAAAYGGYVNSSGILELKSVQAYLKANPAVLNFRNSVVMLEKEWNKLTPEEAQKLAPQLAQTANPMASLVRAIAAGGAGRDYDKVMAALLGPELWRLGPNELNGPWADQLWHYCLKPGGNQKRDEGIAKAKAVAATIASGDAKKEDPADKRIAAFRNLWADYKSAQPKIPIVRARAAAILRFTPELVPELLKDPSPEAQGLVRDAIAAGMEDSAGPLGRDGRVNNLSTSVYDPWLNRLAVSTYGGMDRLKNDKDRYKPHALEPVLRAAVAERLAQGKIEPWLTLAWINLQFPVDNAEQVKLMQALYASPQWQTMPFDVKFAAREWFKKDAMTPGQIAWVQAADTKLVCKDLLSLTNTSDVATVAAALQAVVDGVKKSPVRMAIQGMDKLAALPDQVFTDPEVMSRILDVVDGLGFASDSEVQPFASRLLIAAGKTRDPVVLHRMGACLWSVPRGSQYEPMKELVQSLVETHPAASYALARTGIETLSRLRGAYGFSPAEKIPEVKTLLGKAAMKLGLMDIPVAQTDPAYPVYKAQAEWQGGNEDSAWALCEKSWSELLSVQRQLSIEFQMWLLQRSINLRDEERQEALVKPMLAWAKEPNSTLPVVAQIAIDMAYGDMAVQRSMLKEAHEIFARIEQNPKYAGVKERYQASLRKARVERFAKNFEAALQTLEALEMEKVPELWAAIHYMRAEIAFDQGEYEDAAKNIDVVLARESDNADARIMQGKLQIKRQKLMEATEVEIGSSSNVVRLVPGEKLKVTLSDPALAVSSAGTEVEVEVWAKSGDRERLFLRQFGDQKTKFRGEVATGLGAPAPNDKVLQVIGDDEIYYDYSERFRKKMNNMAEKRGGPITVASDALLMASARKLLTEAEQRVADMQEKMAGLSRPEPTETDGLSRGRAAEVSGSTALERVQARLQEELVKPGNTLYVRVIDPDRSRTPQADEVTVSVSSSSGDSIGRVVLKETGPYTGWFEGHVKTAQAQAMALAENSEPGRNPNMVISPATEYPAWRPVPIAGKKPSLTIDLNDNVALGELILKAAEPGSKLKKFVIQTGMNEREMFPVAVYPVNLVSLANPWAPSVTIMNDTDRYHANNERSVYDFGEIAHHLERGWMSQTYAAGIAENVAGPSVAMTNSIPAKVKWLRNNSSHNSHVIYRFRGYFRETTEVLRRFKVVLGPYEVPKNTHPSVANPPQFLLAVDGKPITSKEKPGNLEGEVALQAGLHRFEIWATGWDCTIGFGRTVKVLANLEDAERLVECPDRFFDPAGFPSGVIEPRNGPASVKASPDGTAFTVQFAPDSRARLLSFQFLEQEGPVPAVSKIELKRPDGKSVLPVIQDFAALNKNDILEVRTGDRVAVRYVDDRYVTKNKVTHERFLNASFTDAKVAFEFFEIRKGRNGEDEEYYEPLLRYTDGQPVLVTVKDPDMDVSATPDKVTVTLQRRGGASSKVEAVETGDATGIFRVWITPLTGMATNSAQLHVAPGEPITAVYRDGENQKPGIPVDRYATLRHAQFAVPELALSHAVVAPIPAKDRPLARPLEEGFFVWTGHVDAQAAARQAKQGWVQQKWLVTNEFHSAGTPPPGGFKAVLGQPLYVEVVAPHLAVRAGAVVSMFVQSAAGRKQGTGQVETPADTNTPAQVTFDIAIPGTMEMQAAIESPLKPKLISQTPGETIPIYGAIPPALKQAAEQTRFVGAIPVILGALPEHGVLSPEAWAAARKRGVTPLPGVVAQPGEMLHVGFRYDDPQGNAQWIVASTKVISHPVLDVMAENYRETVTRAFVGEVLYLRVVDLGADATDRSDTVTVKLKAASGAERSVTLTEVDTHTGVFKAGCVLTYATPADQAGAVEEAGESKGNVFPVVYGDKVEVRYTDKGGQTLVAAPITISKGADGRVAPFSKTYDDPGMAMRTQFALAESSLEVARNYRSVGKAELAEREFESARQLLASVVDQFREPETRAHAEYLLGTLALEDADVVADADSKGARYRAALSRFMNVTASYPDTLHASKAQFKIATVYEKLQEPDIAAQEYVKLAYKYPESEFLATAMARLGSHFQKGASKYEEQAKPLLAQTNNAAAMTEGTALQKMAVREYEKAAQIFGRLIERFPSHELAGTAGLRSGQAYIRAGANRQAVKMLLMVIDNTSYNGPEIRAQAMYWAGMSYESLKEPMAAFSIYKRVTFDFPESKWASYARAQLSQDALQNLEADIEIKRLEKKQ
jgi:tetratricopeptide (TPR) repeat protein